MPTESMKQRTAAFFDVDGTLIRATIAHYYAFLRERRMPRMIRPFWRFQFLIKCAYYLWLDHGGEGRVRSNRAFFRNYRGMDVQETRSAACDVFDGLLRPRLFDEGARCLARHRQEGRLTVLITGSIDFMVQPLAEHLGADSVEAASLVERDDRFTGELASPPVADLEKARRCREYAQRENIDLSGSWAYADSSADLPLLECVGHPCAVNPEKRLAAIARERGWPIERWYR